ncbi:4'-phosphopantetheinyl transferase superfamily protein [Limibacter armeniacum]|uniref:4'-phosphopantetheinyl transferase family protein n=1 Tax=Limibacter armeniacum TaxID=466084 RepID=UPI002FE5EC30
MPFIHQGKVKNTYWGIWEITESETQLTDQLSFHTTEEFSHIKSELQRKQSISGKLAIQTLTENIGMEYNGILKAETGKPFLKDTNARISISHSKHYVAACLNTERDTGIDIELISPRIQRLYSKYMHDEELSHCDMTDTALTFYWCAKEALYKMYGERELIFKDDIRVTESKGLVEKNGRKITADLEVYKHHDFMVVLSY